MRHGRWGRAHGWASVPPTARKLLSPRSEGHILDDEIMEHLKELRAVSIAPTSAPVVDLARFVRGIA